MVMAYDSGPLSIPVRICFLWMDSLTHHRLSGCAGVADFAGLCRSLPSYLVEAVQNQRLVDNS